MASTDVTRRGVLRGGALGTLALAMGRGQAAAQAPAKRPNIVFFLADDLGAADVSCYGRPDIATPNIDGIATRGVRFLQAYANSAVCTATRTALITGRYHYRLPLGLEEPLPTSRNVGLPPEHPTLPSLLKKAGYGTSLIGKWHLGTLPNFGPLQSGYDHFYGFRGGAVDYYSHKGTDTKDDLWDGDVAVHQAGYLTELLGNRAVDAVDAYARSGEPFLLSVHFNAPHWPWEAPGDSAESERIAGSNLRDWDGGSQATYRGMIQAMDAEIGRVLRALDANGLTDDTIVIFTSDNGGERFADTWPFTGRKTELLEGGLRIPSVMAWPARLAPGHAIDQVMISMDWLPTLLAAAETAPDPAFPSDGIDLLPLLAPDVPPVPRKLFWRYKANAQRAARDGDMKYLKILDNTFLFNVVGDPLERANLKDRDKPAFEALIAEWKAWNATMLPEIDDSFTENFTGSQLADHIGTPKTSTKAE
ncbi:MAG TPA: sulfatase-like hydrolase/transferase [Stellaceae bacterium]|nr:sulfatase-like hydrolase/transferase [Stellaceae bacterium]